MKAMAIAAMAALAAGGAAEAQERSKPRRSELFCHDLKRLVREAPDPSTGSGRGWVGMWNARPAPPWLGFRPGACRASAGTDKYPASYWCHQHVAPEHLTLDTLAADTAACLPEAKRLPSRWPRHVAFETPKLRIDISESGGPGAKVGRIVRFRVEAAAAKE